MKYRDIIPNDLWNIEAFSKYIRKEIIKSGLVMIEFTDDDLNEIRELYKSSATEHLKSIRRARGGVEIISVVGSDGFRYFLSDDGIIKQNQKESFSLRREAHFRSKIFKERDKERLYREKRLAEADKTQIVSRPSASSFKAYEYIDKENSICLSFRLRTCKEKNKPLCIYFHGAGAVGRDNIKQLTEFRMLGTGLSRRKATILIPQMLSNCNYIDEYLSSVKKLIEAIAEKTDADKSRIAVFGISFGGRCTWQMLWDYPEYFSCGIPMMGSFYEIQRSKDIDMSRLKNVPIWVAHSANDKIVPIENDDLCVEKLREIGGNVKYTRWKKYGHQMSLIFCRRKKWVDWMLSQSLDNRKND